MVSSIKHGPERRQRLVICGDEFQMTVAWRSLPFGDDARVPQRRGELPVTLAMRLEILELQHRRQQKSVRLLQRHLFNGVTCCQHRLRVKPVKVMLNHARGHGAGTWFPLLISVPDRRVHRQVIAHMSQEIFVGQRFLFQHDQNLGVVIQADKRKSRSIVARFSTH